MPAPAPAPVVGLSKSHNRPFGTITLYRGVSLAKVETRSAFEQPSGNGEQPKRGEITESWDAELWKRQLKVFSQRFIRRFPTAGFIWKLEFQQRGAPHFHPFVWGMSESEGPRAIIEFVSEAWFEVVGSGDEKHFVAGTRVEKRANGGPLYAPVLR